ncbi:uncharacterized protein PAF06_004746 [Gastrophryne carolinensis]
MNRKERGKFSSLNKQEAKMILETYVKRSLSERGTKRAVESKEKIQKKVQRSVSDLSRFRIRAKEIKLPESNKLQVQETKKDDRDGAKNLIETQENDQPANKEKAKAAKKQSWFKNFLNLFKKEENTPDETVPGVSSVTPSTDGHLIRSTRKSGFKKTNIRKALSFKKTVVEDDSKLKRPNHLPLMCINTPSTLTLQEKSEDCYYQQVSTEIEHLVNDTDCTRPRHQSLGGETTDGGSQDTDEVIKKIASILIKEGDAYDSKIKEDPSLSSFFRNISYNSFKKLADVYINKEMKARSSDATPEDDIKFAFSIHFTKQVVGLSSHPANRIMGFGNQYLQDTFIWLSRSRENLNATVYSELSLSPD